ncbi:MAG: trypsin-like serine protease [Thermomicrobiales bacterium]
MSRRGLRIVLVLMMLAMTFASFGSASAAEEARKHVDTESIRFDGIGESGLSRRTISMDDSPSALEAKWQEYRETTRVPQVVVGDDSRIQVTDTTIFPYSAIAQLAGFDESLPEDIIATCTAAFVGPDVLLTAAHCLWSDTEFGGWIDDLLIAPGSNGDQTPFGVISPESMWIPDAYMTNSEPGSPYDYALIVLSNSDTEAQTGSFEIGILTTGELQDQNLNPTTAGYPGDKPFGTQWIASESGFTSVDDNGLIHDIDSIQGQSGSPVWRASDMAVIGIESAESDVENLAVRLDIPIMYEFMQACQELGCRINHFLSDIPGDGAAYGRVWDRTDQPVAAGVQPRTWMWGPSPISKVMFEPYAEAPNGFRTVLYQEKSRMEITDPNADSSSIWYVTNGLATVELMTGMLQLGNNTFEEHDPAEINVAGDGDDPNGPTYRTFASLQNLPPHGPAPTSGTGLTGAPATITATVDRAGNVGDDPSLAGEGVTAEYYVAETGHMVASVFWEFMNSSGTVYQNGQYVTAPLFDNPFFATGYPVTEAYWAKVRVGGSERVVLVQAFQRRVLTYTPGNPAGFLVEAGNVGAHYLQWLESIRAAEDEPGGGTNPPPPVGEEPPAIGDVIATADLANWPEVETTFGDTGAPFGDAYRITNPPEGFLQVLANGSFSDGYFSVDTRVVQASSDSGANCIVYRADPVDDNPLFLESGYWFCIVHEGGNMIGAAIFYETTQDIVALGGSDLIEPTPSVGVWHQIGVVAQGSHYWFVVDDTVIGDFVHDIGPGSGQVGFQSFNFDENPAGANAVYEFSNLQIYALAGSSGPEPPPTPGDNAPAEGEILYQTNLGDLPAVESQSGALGSPSASGAGYNIVGPAQSGAYAFDDVSFGDASYEVQVFSTADSGTVDGCLVVRQTQAGAYHLCLAYELGQAQGSVSYYLDVSAESGGFVDLGTFVFPTPRSAETPITLKIVTQGANHWFYVDGQLVGSATHGTGNTGGIGVAMICLDSTNVCSVGFTNLVVRALAS